MKQTVKFYEYNSEIIQNAMDNILVKIHGEKKKRDLCSVLLTGCGAGAGTTTISEQLAVALAKMGWNTLLVDCDLRKKSRGELQKNHSHIEKLHYVSFGRGCENPVKLLCSFEMERFVEENRQNYDYVIYDMPSVNVVSDAEALFSMMDGILLIAALNHTTKRQIYQAREKVSICQSRYLGIIVNNVEESLYRRYRKDFDHYITGRRKDVKKA